jgi:hypothetical protein
VIYWASILADTLNYHVTSAPPERSFDEVCEEMPPRLQGAFEEPAEVIAQQIAVKVNSLE